MIRVYTASKLSTQKVWRDLEKRWPHVHFHARWLKHIDIGTPDSVENATKFWLEDVEDVLCSDAVLVYAVGDEHLRGALVEAGVAIAKGIPVIVVGDHPDYGTWQYHPGVSRCADLAEAAQALAEMDIH